METLEPALAFEAAGNVLDHSALRCGQRPHRLKRNGYANEYMSVYTHTHAVDSLPLKPPGRQSTPRGHVNVYIYMRAFVACSHAFVAL